MRYEKKYDSDVKYNYVCSSCKETIEVWAGKNTIYRNSKCPRCEDGYLNIESEPKSENRSANISYTYGKEKLVRGIWEHTEKQRNIAKRIGLWK